MCGVSCIRHELVRRAQSAWLPLGKSPVPIENLMRTVGVPGRRCPVAAERRPAWVSLACAPGKSTVGWRPSEVLPAAAPECTVVRLRPFAVIVRQLGHNVSFVSRAVESTTEPLTPHDSNNWVAYRAADVGECGRSGAVAVFVASRRRGR
jgi:hypothetical protein